MDEESDHTISVTHFINPHLFWYRKTGGPDDYFHVLTQLEQKLNELYRNKPATETRCRPNVGDKVAVNFVVWNRYLRAEVLQKAEFQQEEYILWVIDYGFPLLTKKEHLRKLPKELETPVGQIHRGGLLNIQPAVLDYDHIECNLVMVKQDEWLQRACDMMEKLLADASSVIFLEKFQSADDHHWGDLIIANHKGNKFNARTYLQSAKYAMQVDDKLFPKICSNLKTTNIAPWLSNSRKTKLKFNSIKHNIAEHSQQMNSAIIDEFAKRKVQDWCERNARVQNGGISVEHLESAAESVHDQVIDDITFDDSVSVIHQKRKMEQKSTKSSHHQQQHHHHQQLGEDEHINYMGKAGALTKLKQQKYTSKQNLPPQANSKAFDMDFECKGDETFDLSFDKPNILVPAAQTVVSSASSTTNVSARIRRMADVRAERAKKLQQDQLQQQQQQQNIYSSNFNTATSAVSSNDGVATGSTLSTRQQRLAELRKKHSRPELVNKKLASDDAKPGDSQNLITSTASTKTVSSHTQRLLGMRQKYKLYESTTSTEDHSVTYPYHELEQSTTTFNESNLENTQDTASILSAKNARAKQLSEMRRRWQASTNEAVVAGEYEMPAASGTTKKHYDLSQNMPNLNINEENNNPIDILETFDFKLKPKATLSIEKEMNIATLPPMERTKASNKESLEGYDGLTLVPAGFDITRLQTYRNEENHWHRKKSTRNEYLPHDDRTVSSSEEFLINNSHDQSSSSSDFFQIKPPKTSKTSSHSKRLTRPPSSLLRNETFKVPSVQKEEINILDQSVPSITNSDTLIKPLKCSPHLEESSFSRHDNVPTTTTERGGQGARYTSGYSDAVHHHSEISATSSANSSFKSQPHASRKHPRQLKSPSSQISKIDEILHQHTLEKQSGNTNILDLKKLSVSPQKSRRGAGSSETDSNFTTSSTDIFSDGGQDVRTIASNKNSLSSTNQSIDITKTSKSPGKKHMKDIFNYATQLEVKHSEHLPIVDGEITLQTKFIDHLVLAHSSIPLTPIENIAEATFLPEIHEEMRNMRVNKVYRIQVYSWSHVLRGNSLFVVNPARTGKTWSYLPALCSLVCCRYKRLKQSFGPVAIIMVASSRHVESTYGNCRRLMSGLKDDAPTCVPSYGMRNFVDTKVQLLNGCGILVTTPSSLLRLLKDNINEPLFDGERLQHIIIDDMDIMLSRSHEDFESAARIIFKLSKKSKFKTLLPQLIVTSRDWDGVMIRLMRKSNQPLLLIGDFLEAAVYGRATLSVKLKSSREKNDTILRFIKKQAQHLQGDLEHKRILIMCNGDEDVELVMQYITECGYPCLAYYNKSTYSEEASVDEWKKKVSSQILICTDARFPELQIQNVHNLIHYSMPTSWTQFTMRFSALAQTYENFVCKNFEQTPIVATSVSNTLLNEAPAHSMILLDEDNSLQLPRLVDFMRKHNQAVHPDILAVSKRVLVQREESRISKGVLLCPHLMEFGECDDTRCDKRHELTRFDVIGDDDDIPSEGEMRIHILKVYSPTHYAARLLQHKSLNSTKWQEVRRSGETLAFSVQLDLHYRNEENLALHWPPHINDLCMYRYADNFRRALILDAPDLTGKNTNVVQANLRVTLKLVDEGTVISSVKCSELFICDDKFKEFPYQAIDIRLLNVVPFDNERTWDSKTTKQVQIWIMDSIKTSHVVQVGITFALAQTIWVNNLVVMERLSTLGTYRPYVNLKMSLVQKDFAMIYKGERKHVCQIANEYGLLNAATRTTNAEVSLADTSLDEYESCQNDSVDLIKFSSSNGDGVTNSSMESTRCELLHEDADMNLEKSKDCGKAEETKDKEDTKSKVCDEEENWDLLLSDDAAESKQNEVFVPLIATTTPVQPKEESWSQLSLNELVKVEIGDEGENGNWENIFLQIIDKKHMSLFDELMELINKHVSNIKNVKAKEQTPRIYDFEPLHNCIVKYDNLYLRAKVHGAFGTNVKERLYRFFLCDYACFTNVKSHELYNDFFYETSEEIVNFTPYQAVHCTLAGIQWDRFAKRCQVTKEYLYACAVEQRTAEETKSLSLNNLPIHSYKILLYECEKQNEFASAEMFNRMLVNKGITVTDGATKHYLDYKLNCEEEHDENTATNAITTTDTRMINTSSSDESDVYTFEQLLECIKKAQELDDLDNNLLDETKTGVLNEVKESAAQLTELQEQQQVSAAVTANINSSQDYNAAKRPLIINELDDDDEEDHCTTDDSDNKKSSSSITSSNDNNSYVLTPSPVLKALYKRPMTTWYETDCLIFISIYAPDITDYSLEVTQKTVFFSTQIQDDEYVVFLHLLGSVDPQYVSHEIKGLNVVIRLVKNIFVTWPRLLQESTKYSWLKFNYNTFDSSELEYIMPQQRLQAILESAPHVDPNQIYDELDSDDSERDRYQTFNPIETNVDDYDPFS